MSASVKVASSSVSSTTAVTKAMLSTLRVTLEQEKLKHADKRSITVSMCNSCHAALTQFPSATHKHKCSTNLDRTPPASWAMPAACELVHNCHVLLVRLPAEEPHNTGAWWTHMRAQRVSALPQHLPTSLEPIMAAFCYRSPADRLLLNILPSLNFVYHILLMMTLSSEQSRKLHPADTPQCATQGAHLSGQAAGSVPVHCWPSGGR